MVEVVVKTAACVLVASPLALKQERYDDPALVEVPL